MINLLCLLCSLCIQFVAIDLPYNFSAVNTNNYTTITTLWENLVGRGFNVDPNYMIVVYRANQSRQYYVYYPNEPFNQQQSTITLSGRNESTGTLNVTMTNWRRFTFTNIDTYYNLSENSSLGSCSFQLDDGTNWGTSTNIIIWNARYNLPYDNLDTFNWENEVTPVLPPSGSGIGSLSGSGHSSGGSPLDELGNFSWSTMSSTFHSSGHSTGVNPSSATYDFTNAEQNLLGQIVDNTNKLLFNGHSLGEEIKTLNANIISGTSAIFNAISVFNDNFVVQYVYDEEKVNEAINTSNMLLFVQTGNDFIYSMTDLISDFSQDISQQEQIDELVIPIDLRPYNIVYFDTDGYILSRYQPFPEVYQMRFEFLDETKAIWQPLLIAILYFSLTMSIYFDLPNIIRGAVS